MADVLNMTVGSCDFLKIFSLLGQIDNFKACGSRYMNRSTSYNFIWGFQRIKKRKNSQKVNW